jgi:hypothetical protein
MVKNWSFVNSHPAFSGIFATLRLAWILDTQASPSGFSLRLRLRPDKPPGKRVAGYVLRVASCEIRVVGCSMHDIVLNTGYFSLFTFHFSLITFH